MPSLGHLNDLTGDEVRIITRQKAMIPGRWFGCPRRWNGAVLTVVDRLPLLSLSDEGSEELRVSGHAPFARTSRSVRFGLASNWDA